MTDFDAYLLDLHGPDPFAAVRAASESHRIGHAPSLPGGEQECGVYPSDALKMRAMATIVRATGASRILEIGCGLGYSALWLATAAGERGRVQTIDRFVEHASAARSFTEDYGLADRIEVIEGEGAPVLAGLRGPYDVVHDDGWFAAQPAYYDRLAGLIRPGGLLVMSNWSLLEHAVTGESPLDWSEFAGESWAKDVRSYARILTADPRYDVSFIQRPPLALAVRRNDG
jgi:predicted O-methyltransferase YrrM